MILELQTWLSTFHDTYIHTALVTNQLISICFESDGTVSGVVAVFIFGVENIYQARCAYDLIKIFSSFSLILILLR